MFKNKKIKSGNMLFILFLLLIWLEIKYSKLDNELPTVRIFIPKANKRKIYTNFLMVKLIINNKKQDNQRALKKYPFFKLMQLHDFV